MEQLGILITLMGVGLSLEFQGQILEGTPKDKLGKQIKIYARVFLTMAFVWMLYTVYILGAWINLVVPIILYLALCISLYLKNRKANKKQ